MEYGFEIEKARIYVNKCAKTLTAIQKETGADVLINGGLYDMKYKDKPNLWLRVDGQTLHTDDDGYWCYGWDVSDFRMIHSRDIETVQNAICCTSLAKDSKKTILKYDEGQGGVRGRSAIGTLPDGRIVIFCSKDGTSLAMTPEKMQEYCLKNGWKDAIMLDSGGSSQCITPDGKITSTRKVHNVLCFWLKTNTTEGEDSMRETEVKTTLANKKNYGNKRSDIKYLVIHYTGNDGDTDENNGKYFKDNVVEASAHYFVDDDSITQSVPDNYTAWHCGAKKYKHKECRNSNSIGIEICDDVKNGKIYPSVKTIENAVGLTKKLMEKYNIPVENVIRHYDVTGKLCPAYWCGSAEKDKLWESEFKSKLKEYSLYEFVCDVQSVTGSKVDGIAGLETINNTLTVSKVLNRKHPVVYYIQRRLKALGYNVGAIDGIAGGKFKAAVEAFQKDNDCTVDGEVTARARTWRILLGMT